MDFVQIINYNDNAGDDGEFGKEMWGVLWKGSCKPQKISGTKYQMHL